MPFRCVANITCVNKPEPPPDMSFRANAVSRGIFPSCRFTLWWFIIQRGGFLHSAYAQGLNDTMGNVDPPKIVNCQFCIDCIDRNYRALATKPCAVVSARKGWTKRRSGGDGFIISTSVPYRKPPGGIGGEGSPGGIGRHRTKKFVQSARVFMFPVQKTRRKSRKNS